MSTNRTDQAMTSTFAVEFIFVGAIPALALVAWFGIAYAARLAGIEPPNRARLLIGWGAFVTVWLGLAFLLGVQGFFRAHPDRTFPTIALGIVVPILAGLVLVRGWPLLRRALVALPQHWLIGVQLYRCFGGVFLILYAQGRMPGEFALPAGYGDIAIGIAAPVVAWLYFRSRPASRLLAGIWNIAGIGDLVVAVTLGFLTSPSPFQQLAFSLPNELISTFPLVLVPTFAVPLAILLHIVSLWRLAAHRPGSRQALEGR